DPPQSIPTRTQRTAHRPRPEGLSPMHTHGPVLLAGGLADVDFITDYFRQLPPPALHSIFGTVFIEVESRFDISTLDVPAGIGVHWLVREDIDAGSAQPGLPLVQAVQ